MPRKPTTAHDADRPLPHDLDAERAVLGGVLIENALFHEASHYVHASDFFRLAHRLVWQALADLLSVSDGVADLLTVKDALATRGQVDEVGGVAYLSKLTDGVPRHTNVGHYAQIVREHAMRRRVIHLADGLTAKAYACEESAETLLASADVQVVRLRHGLGSGRMQLMAESQPALIEDFERRVATKGQLSGVTTGFASIDELTGGWQAGDMIVVAARPSIGKTTFALNAALAAARTTRPDGTPRRVAIFSLEMRRQQLEYRLLSSLSGVSLSRILSGYLSDESPDFQRVIDALQLQKSLAIAIDDTAGHSVWDLRGECRRLQADGGLDLVVVDYIQLMAPSSERRLGSRNDEVTETSRKLKVMADELSCPVIVVSQLNRAGEVRADPRPRLSDLRESGALEQDADLVCFLHRKHHREGGSTEFVIEKQRNGPTGTVYLTMHRETVHFEDGGEPPPPPTPDDERETERKRRREWFGRR